MRQVRFETNGGEDARDGIIDNILELIECGSFGDLLVLSRKIAEATRANIRGIACTIKTVKKCNGAVVVVLCVGNGV
jgi:stalled ribosome rescue protein Dom34